MTRTSHTTYRCPSCSSNTTCVKDTRFAEGQRRRTRLCSGCGHRWNTVEVDADLGKLMRDIIRQNNALLDRAQKIKILTDRLNKVPLIAGIEPHEDGEA